MRVAVRNRIAEAARSVINNGSLSFYTINTKYDIGFSTYSKMMSGGNIGYSTAHKLLRCLQLEFGLLTDILESPKSRDIDTVIKTEEIFLDIKNITGAISPDRAYDYFKGRGLSYNKLIAILKKPSRGVSSLSIRELNNIANLSNKKLKDYLNAE